MDTSILTTRLEMLALYASGRSYCSNFPSHRIGLFRSHRHKFRRLFLTRCSAKPGVDSNNATNTNPAIEMDSSPKGHQLSAPPSNPPLTSTCSEGLVFDLGTGSSWDSAEIGSPVVKRFIGDNEERWYMWYHGRSELCDNASSDGVGLAVSSNGIHWARGSDQVASCSDVGIVMKCRESWWAFDTESVRPSEIVIMSSPMYSAVYWLYYTGYSSVEIEIPGNQNIRLKNPESVHENCKVRKILKSLPGLACSQDGRHWARIEGDHHSGALLDVGSSKDWDSLLIAKPQVVIHSPDDLRMYYYSFDAEKGHFAIGMARSRDGIRWVKLGKIMEEGGSKGCFDEFGVKNAHVVRNRKEGNYLMAYEGVGADGKRSIGLAVSPDGLKNWKRLTDEPILAAADEDGWDSKDVGSPYLIQMEDNIDEWRLYYVGVGHRGGTGIGMAVSDGSKIRSLRRWEGFPL